MKWDKRTRIVIFSGAVFVASALSMHALVARLSAVNQCVVTSDNRLSADISAQITGAIERHVCAGKSYANIAAAIIQEFSCVDDIVLHHCAPGVLYGDIISVQPLIHVNDTHVVSNDGVVMSPDNFSPALLHTLHVIRVDNLDEKACMPHSFITTVQALIPSFLDSYDAYWVDENKLVLLEKESPHFSLICNAQKLPDERLVACCQQLKNDVCSKVSKKQYWAADIRFEHQIILTNGVACQGGVAHG